MSVANASPLTDFSAEYAFMRIDRVRVADETRTPKFYRHTLTLQAGIDGFTFGLIGVRTDRGAETPAEPESGLMLSLGYSAPISDWLLWEARARVPLTPHTNERSPLYAADADLLGKVVAFAPDGWGPLNLAVSPSLSAGAMVNRFGRLQLFFGAGLWWKGLGVYATGLTSLRGIENPLALGPEDVGGWAAVENRLVTLSVSYDLDLGMQHRLRFEARKNIPLSNAGNDTVGVLTYRFFFDAEIAP
ncbi:MAG: hypothetical protein RMA76_11880 [Deltaproteobacteria bacterium]